MDPVEIRKIISEKIPDGSVVPRHTADGHFYEVVKIGKTFPSVTGKLQLLKDEGLINFKMNRALDYIFRNWQSFNDTNIMEHLDAAAREPVTIFNDAGDVGTEIHNAREAYFTEWIRTGARPADVLAFVPPEQSADMRITSALRALEKFCIDHEYIPIVTEKIVYNEQFEIAGTLDDIGIATYKGKRQLVLLDLKTSNQFKDHYFFQVAMYHWMFKELTGLKPKINIILKLSKENGTYAIEKLESVFKLIAFAKHMLHTHRGVSFIREMRKDNNKRVATI